MKKSILGIKYIFILFLLLNTLSHKENTVNKCWVKIHNRKLTVWCSIKTLEAVSQSLEPAKLVDVECVRLTSDLIIAPITNENQQDSYSSLYVPESSDSCWLVNLPRLLPWLFSSGSGLIQSFTLRWWLENKCVVWNWKKKNSEMNWPNKLNSPNNCMN